jgi:hypothetical protein
MSDQTLKLVKERIKELEKQIQRMENDRWPSKFLRMTISTLEINKELEGVLENGKSEVWYPKN